MARCRSPGRLQAWESASDWAGLKAGQDFHLCFSPERVNPGDKQFPMYAIPKVIGGMTTRCTELAGALYSQVVCEIEQAVHLSLAAPEGAVRGQIFNVGSNDQNYRVIEIAQIVANEFPGCTLTVGEASADNRWYRVNFDRIGRILPEFRCRWLQ